jgi:hypothetical protein
MEFLPAHGRYRVQAALAAHEHHYAEPTVGRILARVRARCPIVRRCLAPGMRQSHAGRGGDGRQPPRIQVSDAPTAPVTSRYGADEGMGLRKTPSNPGRSATSIVGPYLFGD